MSFPRMATMVRSGWPIDGGSPATRPLSLIRYGRNGSLLLVELGAVAVVDALGFKDIWRRESPARVLAKLRGLRSGTETAIKGFHDEVSQILSGSGADPRLEVMFLSDTIIIGATLNGEIPEHRKAWSSVMLASYATSLLVSLAARSTPALCYRGCIAVGDFAFDEPFVVGPAVDEAASLERLAEAAIVWFAPSAEAAIERAVEAEGPKVADAGSWLRWTVPMKNGAGLDTRAVMPFFPAPIPQADYTASVHDIVSVQRQLLATFSGPGVDVLIKKQNTERFLNAAAERLTDRR